jgi:hypothetical protein
MAWKFIRRALLYLAIAIASLLFIALLLAINIHFKISSGERWVGLAYWTAILLWIILKARRAEWDRLAFWAVTAGLVFVHLFAFAVTLIRFPQWRFIWFVPVFIFEAVLFGVALDALLPPRTREQISRRH